MLKRIRFAKTVSVIARIPKRRIATHVTNGAIAIDKPNPRFSKLDGMMPKNMEYEIAPVAMASTMRASA